MDLTPYEGGFLQPGVYWARIVEFENVEANTGTRGLKVTFQANGKTTNGTFWMYDAEGKPSKAIWRLASLCVAAGLTEDERKDFHAVMLQGKSVGIEVKQQDRHPEYCEVGLVYSEKEYAFQAMGKQLDAEKVDLPVTDAEAPTPEAQAEPSAPPEPKAKAKKDYGKDIKSVDCPF